MKVLKVSDTMQNFGTLWCLDNSVTVSFRLMSSSCALFCCDASRSWNVKWEKVWWASFGVPVLHEASTRPLPAGRFVSLSAQLPRSATAKVLLGRRSTALVLKKFTFELPMIVGAAVGEAYLHSFPRS